MKDQLGNRIKGYEKVWNVTLPKRMPVIIRIDGKAFHSLLRDAKKPFDDSVKVAMDNASIELIDGIQGAKIAYIQSDEISVLVNTFSSLEFSPWFDNKIQKICSVSASIATRAFNKIYKKLALFDSRVFILPMGEVCNYFIWRQQDATRNSVQMMARSMYSHKECENKSCSQLQEMIFKKGKNYNDYPTWQKRGRCVLKETYLKEEVLRTRIKIDDEIPIFTKDRFYIERHLEENKNE